MTPQHGMGGLGKDGHFTLAHVACALFFALAMVVWALVHQWQKYEDVLGSAAPRVARLAGLLEARAAIEAQLEASRIAMQSYAYPASTDAARVASDLQARVRDVFQAAGMSVAGSQQFPIRPGQSYDEILMSVSALGTLTQFNAALEGVRELAPVAMIEHLRIQPQFIATAANERPSQVVSIQVRLVTIRMRGG